MSYFSAAFDAWGLDTGPDERDLTYAGLCCKHCGGLLDVDDYDDTEECRGCVEELAKDWAPLTKLQAGLAAVEEERWRWTMEWVDRVAADWSAGGIGKAVAS